ncbi:MAG: FHA domain-containing protein [Pirellulaceae bacterium]
MRFILEITSQPAIGQRFWLRAGQTAEIGRSDQAAFAIPHDHWMSSLHFRVECDEAQCRLQDLDSRNGTTVNGRKVTHAVLADGDLIVAGETTFRVHIEGAVPPRPDEPGTLSQRVPSIPIAPPASRPRYRVGHWLCNLVPEGWELVADQGMRSMAQGEFPSSLMFSETAVDDTFNLQEHVDTLIRQYLEVLKDCRTEGAAAVEVAGTEEARQFLLEYPQRGDVALRQRYVCVRQSGLFGMAVLTTSQTELEKLGFLLDQLLAELAWAE